MKKNNLQMFAEPNLPAEYNYAGDELRDGSIY